MPKPTTTKNITKQPLDAVAWEALIKEFKYTSARSGGSGGQHVNKVETKVILHFNLLNSEILSPEQKNIIKHKLSKRIDKDSFLSMYCQATRSQHKNKERVTKNFIRLLKNCLKVKKKRKATKISKEVKQKILHNKRRKGNLKQLRKKPSLDD